MVQKGYSEVVRPDMTNPVPKARLRQNDHIRPSMTLQMGVFWVSTLMKIPVPKASANAFDTQMAPLDNPQNTPK